MDDKNRPLVIAVVTAGTALALIVVVSVGAHFVRTWRVRKAVRQAMEEAYATPPSAPPRTAEAITAPAATAAPVVPALLSARELAKRSLPATVSLRCRDSIGSGFFVEPDVVLTNAHVLCPMGEKIQVVLADGRQFTGETVRANQPVDLAIVRVPGAKEPPLPLGDVEGLALGDRVMMIGSPVGLEFTVHEGSISHMRRIVQGVAYFQLDAKINPGNSGGPIIDGEGRVVGVVTLKQTAAEGIGLAVPINYAYSRELSFVNPPSAAAAGSEVFKTMLSYASANGGMQLPDTTGVSIEVRPILGAVDVDQYRRLIVRLLRVQDQAPGYEEVSVNVWASTEQICTLKGDVYRWKEVDPDKAGSGVSDEVLRALKKLGALHIFMGEAALATQTCNPDRMVNLELELVGGNPISNRLLLRAYD